MAPLLPNSSMLSVSGYRRPSCPHRIQRLPRRGAAGSTWWNFRAQRSRPLAVPRAFPRTDRADSVKRHSRPDGCRTGQGRTAGVIRVTAGRVALCVQDDGPGFPEDFLPHAFERFSRADTARGPADGGAGLGLSIVELISGVHGGQARVANRPEGGAEVTVEIPEPR